MVEPKLTYCRFFNYEWDMKRAIQSLSRTKAVRIDRIPSRAFKQGIKAPK